MFTRYVRIFETAVARFWCGAYGLEGSYAWPVQLSTYRRISVPLRAALLMPLAALAVHQLRYLLVFGSHAPSRLARDRHAYLTALEPLALLVGTIALGAFVGRLTLAWRDGGRAPGVACPAGGAPRHALARTWLVCAAALCALFCVQELAEGMLAGGHAAGISTVVGHGGLIAAPLSLLIGAALTLALSTAERLVALVARHAKLRRATVRHASSAPRRRPRVGRDWRLEPASGPVAGRAPPLARAYLS